jgi:hypothetical protein
MIDIAERAGIAHGCLMLTVSYDDLLLNYKEKYDSQVRQYVPILPRLFTTPIVPYVPAKAKRFRPKGLKYRKQTAEQKAAKALLALSKGGKNE